MYTGWRWIDEYRYYFDSNGAMQTGWQKIGGKWYYMNGNGAMQTGWLKISGKWYFFDGSGGMVTGSRTINGTTYYFKGDGSWIDPYNDVVVKVVDKAKQYYSNVRCLEYKMTGSTEEVVITRPNGDGAIAMGIVVDLNTGKATCNGFGGYYTWEDFYSKIPYSFYIW